MTNQGDDCYFFFYSTCTKGDGCPFRHCEAALGCETVCTLWQEGRCFRQVCKFRHMEIDKKRSEISCYWESQPTGCQKLNCAFHHSKPRYIDGTFLLPSKNLLTKPEPQEEEVKVPQVPVQQNKLPPPSNPSPQLRGVMKVENAESVPSPTHPPVVINAADDDEDDDDQFSEEGEEGKIALQQPVPETPNGVRIISTRTNPKKDASLDFGIKTLDEIRQKKMKEKQKKPETSSLTLTLSVQPKADSGIEKENLRTVVRTVTLTSRKATALKEGGVPVRRSLSERLGKRKVLPDSSTAELTKKDALEEIGLPLKRSLAARLGKKIDAQEGNPDELPAKARKSIRERLGLPADQTNTDSEKAVKSTGEICVKTLEEIRLEKVKTTEGESSTGNPPEAERPPKQVRNLSEIRVKTFSEALYTKKKRELEQQKVEKSPPKETEEKKPASLMLKVPKQPVGELESKAKPLEEVRVKTLEEIRREKALKSLRNAERLASPETSVVSQSEVGPTKRRLLRIHKAAAVKGPDKEEKSTAQPAKPAVENTAAAAAELSVSVKESADVKVQVKSFAEIMREKQLRKQQEAEKKVQKDVVQKEKSVSPSLVESGKESRLPITEKGQVRSLLVPGFTSNPQAEQVVARSLQKTNLVPGSGEPAVVMATAQRSPENKVKPKVNVKPSVVKTSSPVGLGQKRKVAESHPSAVAAVKPLSNSTTTETKEPSTKIVVMSAPSLALEERTVPQITPSLEKPKDSVHLPVSGQPAPSCAAVKTRRQSSLSSKLASSLDDDFEALMKEFADDKLEAEIELDPGKDEDDLLQELSEMIDS
ncbi:zinc finger CCCH domain-containing protein 11A [Latimeria chalumnae]|uniref:Zinc finger CCCH-type containing 11A n=1 Tax=Latimeria chalumnae TaxID=7897 RepID=H3AXV9_LATCH|nr:PREDICTED: zinc finger CCCH domain-containing protein 11A [Latimeria chalumnae]XP_014341420.1 PREDICTED: zinc finger CCCH domain-containing protein 11A [Latimeria chalumnae]XP_014341421.1 PREDICTED: zinc finger CCCH domain-containing protein 11A [Latimeria chalumnae]XP_014341422.1 PREDICTED: zinc finger CCCH domain-containing protein 11A [Latimeria chalumnae]|eukprot:XP_005991751.1 PREDICTED: zinc finger CCCH domain-containing protein 11A [Latimeria chalumnae]